MKKDIRATQAFGLYCFLIAIYLSVGGFLQYRLGMIGISINEILVLAMPALLYAHFTGLNLKKTFPISIPAFQDFLLILILSAIIIVPIELLVRLQEHFWPLPKSIATFYENLLRRETWFDAILQGIVLALIPAICEEFFFRGLLQSLWMAYFGPWKSILLTALFFAVAHLNPWYLPYYFLLGVFLGWVRHWKNNLFLCMVAHLVNNLYSLYG